MYSKQKDVLKNFANSQRNTCAKVFFDKVAGLVGAVLKKVAGLQEICKNFKKIYFYRAPLVTASDVMIML